MPRQPDNPPLAPKPVAITGATGFIGRAVVEHLIRCGRPVRAISRAEFKIPNMTFASVRRVESYHSVEAMTEAISGCQCVVHLADRANRSSYNRHNIREASDTARCLTEAIKSAGIERLIAISSIYADAAEHGRPSSYGLSKLYMEQSLQDGPTIKNRSVILRLPPVYGPGSSGAIAILAKLVSTGAPLPFAKLETPRPLLSINNLIGLIDTLLRLSQPKWKIAAGRIYTPDDGMNFGLEKIIKYISRATGRKIHLFYIPYLDKIINKHSYSSVDLNINLKILKDYIEWSPINDPEKHFSYLNDR